MKKNRYVAGSLVKVDPEEHPIKIFLLNFDYFISHVTNMFIYFKSGKAAAR